MGFRNKFGMTLLQSMKKWLPNIFLILILALAAFLRLYKIGDYLTFLGDEGRDVLVVYNILHGKFTLLGPTSSVGGFFLGPIYYYFMAPFLWLFNYNPVGPAVMVALFGIATVWFVYFIGAKFFGKPAGLVASFLYTVSPIIIAYSRSSWNPNLMPIFTLLTLFTLYKAVTSGITAQGTNFSIKKKNMFLFLVSGFLLGITIQFHYLATFVGIIMFVYILFSEFILENRENKGAFIWDLVKKYVLIFLGFLVGLSPLLAFEVRHGFPNTISITKFIFNSPDVKAGGNFFGTIENVFFRLFGRLITDFPPPEQVSLNANQTIFIWYALTLLLGIVCTGYFFICLFKVWKKDREKLLQYLLIATWLVMGIVLFGFYKKSIYDYYLGFLFPLPFLLIGNFVGFLLQKNIIYKIIAGVLVISLGYINLQAMPFRFPPNRQLNQAEEISKFVLDQTNDKPFNFALITGGNSDHAYRYFFTIWNRPPVTIENTTIDPKRTSVTDQLLVVCESNPCAPLGASLWEVAGFGRAEIAGQWPVSVVQVYKLTHYQPSPQPTSPPHK